MESRQKDNRSGGNNFDRSKINIEGDVAGRDIHKTINVPPEPKQNELDKLKGALINALAKVGIYVFGFLAFISLGLSSDPNNSELSCIGIPLAIIFIVLAVFSYNVANYNK
ncbi:MAG: hypothetical protein U0V02_13635 [Anaerolineales bacterium]